MNSGLARFDGAHFQVFEPRNTPELGISDVTALAEDRQGTLWIATRLGGLALFQNSQFTPIPASDRLPVQGARCITPTRDGSVWVGTGQGAYRYFGQRRVEVLQGQGVLSNDDVRAIAESPDGSLWLGTSYGLNRRLDGQMTVFTTVTNAPPLDVVIALHADSDGSLWIGTMTRGFFLHRNGRFTHFGPAEGLNVDGIVSITPDCNGALWLGSDRGVIRVTRESLLAVAEGTAKSVSARVFSRQDGLRTEESTGIIQPPATLDSQGRLWVSTSEGLATIEPASIPRNVHPPLIHIERVAVEGPDNLPSLAGRTIEGAASGATALPPTVPEAGEAPAPAALKRSVFDTSSFDTLWIPPAQDRIEFQYSGLSYVTPEAVSFQYKLDGYDRDWVSAGSRRVAYYTRIPAGRYTFRVRAMNEDGVMSDPGAALTVFMTPAWWQKPWLRILGVGLVCTVLATGVHLRSRRLERR